MGFGYIVLYSSQNIQGDFVTVFVSRQTGGVNSGFTLSMQSPAFNEQTEYLKKSILSCCVLYVLYIVEFVCCIYVMVLLFVIPFPNVTGFLIVTFCIGNADIRFRCSVKQHCWD